MPAMNLRMWQQTLIDSIYGDVDPNAALKTHIHPAVRINSDTAVAIYRRNNRGARRTALEQTFPAIRTLIGESLFAQVLNEYLDLTPSLGGDLNLYGADFADFLQVFTEGGKFERGFESSPYLAELADFEYQRQYCYYAPNLDRGDLLTPATLAAHEDLYVNAAPSLVGVLSGYPLPAIHAALVLDQDAADIDVALQNPVCWLLYRQPDFAIVTEQISADAWRWLQALRARCPSLSEAVDLAECWALPVDTLLPEWVRLGWLSLLRRPEPSDHGI